MTEYEFNLYISAEEFQKFYSGTVKRVVAEDVKGVKVQFPASILRPFVSADGVRGHFLIRMDNDNKLIDIRRIS